jgi:hypothetical protein
VFEVVKNVKRSLHPKETNSLDLEKIRFLELCLLEEKKGRQGGTWRAFDKFRKGREHKNSGVPLQCLEVAKHLLAFESAGQCKINWIQNNIQLLRQKQTWQQKLLAGTSNIRSQSQFLIMLGPAFFAFYVLMSPHSQEFFLQSDQGHVGTVFLLVWWFLGATAVRISFRRFQDRWKAHETLWPTPKSFLQNSIFGLG